MQSDRYRSKNFARAEGSASQNLDPPTYCGPHRRATPSRKGSSRPYGPLAVTRGQCLLSPGQDDKNRTQRQKALTVRLFRMPSCWRPQPKGTLWLNIDAATENSRSPSRLRPRLSFRPQFSRSPTPSSSKRRSPASANSPAATAGRSGRADCPSKLDRRPVRAARNCREKSTGCGPGRPDLQ